MQAHGWAKAQQIKSGLSRLRGQMRFQGSALAQVGTLIDVQGVGERFNGTVFVTGVTHKIESGDWTTEVEFGAPPEWFTERSDVLAPAAAGLVPGIEGLHVSCNAQVGMVAKSAATAELSASGQTTVKGAMVMIGSLPAAVLGDNTVCVGPPDTIVKGSATVLIGGRPAARMGDTTAHGGSVVMGLPTVLIGG